MSVPTHVPTNRSDKVDFLCPAGHTWNGVYRQWESGMECPLCAPKSRRVVAGVNDLATTHPHLVNEWSSKDISPSSVKQGSKMKISWRCDKGHIWVAPVNTRTKGHGCPYCAGTRPDLTANNITVTHPELASQWSKKNDRPADKFSFGSKAKVWWECDRGHTWLSTVNNRSSGNGCPTCSGKKVTAGINDIATTHPELASQWGPDNIIPPDQVSAGSEYRAQWLCPDGHLWYAVVYSRLKNACPHCTMNGKSKAEEDFAGHLLERYTGTVIRNTRTVIPPKELDFYLPDIKVGIEFNGRYWHHDERREEYKRELCENLGISLHVVWDDEWQADKNKTINDVIDFIKEHS